MTSTAEVNIAPSLESALRGRLRDDNLARAFVGSEGTLVTVLHAELVLVEVPGATGLDDPVPSDAHPTPSEGD